MNDYLTSLRDVERRIQKTEEQSAKEVPDVARPAGIPESFDEHAHLLYDLQLLAYQSDITRVITFMYGREQSPRPYPQIGVPEPHHPVTHHQNDPVKMEKCVKIQQYHLKLFADYLEKLRNTPDGDGSLLDHVMILYGAGISNSDRHTHGPLPTLVVGGGAGHAQGRPPSRLSRTHAADEPAAHDAEPARRADGEAGRQHRTIQGALRAGCVRDFFPVGHPSAPCVAPEHRPLRNLQQGGFHEITQHVDRAGHGFGRGARPGPDPGPAARSGTASHKTNWWSQAGGENGPDRIVWAAQKSPETPYAGANKPIWHIADVLKAHQGQARWEQKVLLTRDFDGRYVQMAPGDKSKCMF